MGKKRVDLSGQLLLNLFESILKKRYLSNASMLIKKILADERDIAEKIGLIFDARIITKEIISSMSTGNWVGSGIKGCNFTGIAQTLKR